MAFATSRFAEQGYHPTSVSEIVAGLGVGKGVFYWYGPRWQQGVLPADSWVRNEVATPTSLEGADLCGSRWPHVLVEPATWRAGVVRGFLGHRSRQARRSRPQGAPGLAPPSRAPVGAAAHSSQSWCAPSGNSVTQVPGGVSSL